MKRIVLLALIKLAVLTAALSLISSSPAQAQTFTPFCFGTVSACPCANGGGPGEGCLNSFGRGGKIDAAGNAQISNDQVVLSASQLPTTASIIFFQGDAMSNNGFGTVFGDGLRCADGFTWRIATRIASGGNAYFGIGNDLPVSVKGHLPPTGGTYHYQGFYRNSASFCTPDGFNLTNGVTIVWTP